MSNIIKPTAQSKWARVKDALKEGLDHKKANVLDVLMENTRRDFVARAQSSSGMLMENASGAAVSTGNIATLNKVILPIMRRVMPNVIANEIIGVQPMPGPVAQIVSMRYVYGTTSVGAGTTAGEEMLTPLHIRDIAASYSGNEVAATPAGGPTAQLEGVPGNAVKLTVLKQLVQAKGRRLSARWTVEAKADSMNQYGIDLENEMLAGVATHMTVEVDQEILRHLRSLPATPTAANTFSQASVAGQPTSVVDEFAALAVLINRQANNVATRTRMGKANWAVVSPTALTILESARASAFARTTEGQWEAPTNNKYVGMLNNSLKLYVDTYADDATPVLVGFKGDSEAAVALVYAPYIPLTSSGTVIDPNTFEEVTSFSTRYSIVDFTNTQTSLGNSADFLGLVGINAANLSFL